jgi:hypothetical protein
MEIKFRGQRVDNKEWVYGDVRFTPHSLIGKCWIYDIDRPHKYEVTPETIGQFTGSKDKNEKEIYSGDIITNGDCEIKYIVEWHDCGFKARQIPNQSFIGLTYWKKQIEVIGNKFENLELLEEPCKK